MFLSGASLIVLDNSDEIPYYINNGFATQLIASLEPVSKSSTLLTAKTTPISITATTTKTPEIITTWLTENIVSLMNVEDNNTELATIPDSSSGVINNFNLISGGGNTISDTSSGADELLLFDVDSYLAQEIGPKTHFDTPLRIFLTVLYSLILLTGICGNLLTCFVILRNRVMHTPTNLYILNLSVADFITLIAGLPVETFFLWQQYPWPFGFPLCVLRTALIEFAAYNSVMTITAFTTERYIAICHPLRSASFKSKSSAVRILAVVWLIASVFSLPFALSARVYAERKYPGDTGIDIADSIVCNIPLEHQYIMRIAIQISAYLFFLIPLVYVSLLYALIGASIRRSLFGQIFKDKKSSTPLLLGNTPSPGGNSNIFNNSTYSGRAAANNDSESNTKQPTSGQQQSATMGLSSPNAVVGSLLNNDGNAFGCSSSSRYKLSSRSARRYTAPTAQFFKSRFSSGRFSGSSKARTSADSDDLRNEKSFGHRPLSQLEATPSRRRSTIGATAGKRASAPLYLVAVVIAFFICWCPFHLQRLLSIYLAYESFVEHQTFFNFLFNISGVLFYVSPTVNPILYSLLSIKFRAAFIDTFTFKKGKRSRLSRRASSCGTAASIIRNNNCAITSVRSPSSSSFTTGHDHQMSMLASSRRRSSRRSEDAADAGLNLISPTQVGAVAAASTLATDFTRDESPSSRLLKSALKSVSMTTTTTNSAYNDSPKKNSSTQTTLTFPSSMLFPNNDNGHQFGQFLMDKDAEKAKTSTIISIADGSDTVRSDFGDTDSQIYCHNELMTSAGYLYLGRLNSPPLHRSRFLARNSLPRAVTAMEQQNPALRSPSLNLHFRNVIPTRHSLSSRRLVTTQAAPLFDSAKIINCNIVAENSAADIVDQISDLYNGDDDDDADLQIRIKQLSPAASRKARILAAYNDDKEDCGGDDTCLQVVVVDKKQPNSTYDNNDYNGFQNYNVEDDADETAPLASPEMVSSTDDGELSALSRSGQFS